MITSAFNGLPPFKSISMRTSQYPSALVVHFQIFDQLLSICLLSLPLLRNAEGCLDHKLKGSATCHLRDCKLLAHWMKEEGKRVDICVHGVKLLIENCFSMLPEPNVFIFIKLKTSHCTCTPNEFKQAVSERCLPSFKD